MPATLRDYFVDDDGSLPEIELHFVQPPLLVSALEYLFGLPGARDVTPAGCAVWNNFEDREEPYRSPQDAQRVLSGELASFHRLLGFARVEATMLPDLGVFVSPGELNLNYRMGPHWGEAEIGALLRLLARLRERGARVAVPWWRAAGERAFLAAMEAAE